MKKMLVLLLLLSVAYANNIIIATGEDTGNYYKIGKEINSKIYNGKAQVLKTSGSVQNMLLVAEGKADIALVQEDALSMLDIIYSKKKLAKYDLVDIAGYLYKEHLHILVHKNSNIKYIEELNGKTISFGGKKSGSSITASFVEEQYNINFDREVNTSIEEGLKLLSKNKLDALFYVTKLPSRLLSKQPNIRLLEATLPITNNKDIRLSSISKNNYTFLKKKIKAYSVNTILIVKKGSKEIAKVQKYLKNKGLKVIGKEVQERSILKTGKVIEINKKILDLYTRRYGNRALIRFNHINKYLDRINNLSKETDKLLAVNLLINKIYFKEDKQHWKKKDYWASPLEFIGTGIGDSEEFALIKLLIYSKLGLDNTKFKVISKKEPLKVKNQNIKENISLAYFLDDYKKGIIMDYNPKESKIYISKDQNYKIIKKAKNPIWQKALVTKLTEKDIDTIFNNLK